MTFEPGRYVEVEWEPTDRLPRWPRRTTDLGDEEKG
jgi:hypothetical protein